MQNVGGLTRSIMVYVKIANATKGQNNLFLDLIPFILILEYCQSNTPLARHVSKAS